jgi:vacuolar-type H+-ATPase subunit H
MKEIIEQIIKKEQEAKAKVEAAEKEAENIVLDAEKNAAIIVEQAKINALKISTEMIKNAEKEIEKKKQEILQAEKNNIDIKKKNWGNLIDTAASRIFYRIIDIEI